MKQSLRFVNPNFHFYAWKAFFLIVLLVTLDNAAMAQVPTDTTKKATDTTVIVTDTIQPAPVTTTAVPPATDEGKKRRFSIYAGGNSNTMSGETAQYNANAGVGYHFGVAWTTAGFVYSQFGVRYNNAAYGFQSNATSKDTGDLKVQAIDVPISLGINFLSFAKIVSLRAYISAMPSFTIGVSDNNFGIDKDDVNSFIFYGQIGIGADIAFGLIDIGYNYGTSSLMENSTSNTNPGQFYLSLGIRF